MDEAILAGRAVFNVGKTGRTRTPWTDWTFLTCANDGLQETDLTQFSTGGKASSTVADQWLLTKLADLSTRFPDAMLIAEERKKLTLP